MRIEIYSALSTSGNPAFTITSSMIKKFEEKERSMQSESYFGYEAGSYKVMVYEQDWLLENILYDTDNFISNTTFYNKACSIIDDDGNESVYCLSRKNISYDKKSHFITFYFSEVIGAVFEALDKDITITNGVYHNLDTLIPDIIENNFSGVNVVRGSGFTWNKGIKLPEDYKAKIGMPLYVYNGKEIDINDWLFSNSVSFVGDRRWVRFYDTRVVYGVLYINIVNWYGYYDSDNNNWEETYRYAKIRFRATAYEYIKMEICEFGYQMDEPYNAGISLEKYYEINALFEGCPSNPNTSQVWGKDKITFSNRNFYVNTHSPYSFFNYYSEIYSEDGSIKINGKNFLGALLSYNKIGLKINNLAITLIPTESSITYINIAESDTVEFRVDSQIPSEKNYSFDGFRGGGVMENIFNNYQKYYINNPSNRFGVIIANNYELDLSNRITVLNKNMTIMSIKQDKDKLFYYIKAWGE